jgi:hypothetical protein
MDALTVALKAVAALSAALIVGALVCAWKGWRPFS